MPESIISKFHDLPYWAIALKLTLTGQINQASGINTWPCAGKYFAATYNCLETENCELNFCF